MKHLIQQAARASARLLPPLLTLALVAGCGGSKPTAPGESFQDVLAAGGDFAPIEVGETETVTGTNEFVDNDGTRWKCTTTTVDRTDAPDKYKNLDPNSEVVWPGALVQGETVGDATPEPIDVERAGGTVSIDLLNGSSGVAVTVDQMTQSGIRTAMNEIIADNNGIGSANFNFEFSEVQSREQLAASLDVNVKTLTTGLDARLRFSSDESLHRVLVKLDQVYYSMSWDRPTSMAKIFAPEVTPTDLARFVGPGNPACYISQVTYGRVFYLLIESSASREALSASVRATYKAAVTKGKIEAGAKYVNELENVNIQVFALGGDPDLALATFQGDFDAVSDFLTRGGDITTGRPLSYTMRAVKDNRTVYVKVNNTFDVEECEAIPVEGPAPIVWYSADYGMSTTDILGLPALKAWEDRFGDANRTAQPRTFTYAGWVLPWTTINSEGDRRIVNFTPWENSGGSAGNLGFPGLGFENTDYTLMIVARSRTQPHFGQATWMTWGSDRSAGRMLGVAFDDDTTILVSHGGDLTLTAPTAGQVQANFKLYTFRFSQTEGMRIYVNGALAASDPSFTQPIVSFSAATIGAADDRGFGSVNFAVDMAEFKAFGEALGDADRVKFENELRLRYDL